MSPAAPAPKVRALGAVKPQRPSKRADHCRIFWLKSCVACAADLADWWGRLSRDFRVQGCSGPPQREQRLSRASPPYLGAPSPLTGL